MLTTPPTLPESAPFTSEQRAWINGYLAGLYASQSAGIAAANTHQQSLEPLHVFFGSQTGTAEGLAHRFSKVAGKRGFAPQVKSLAEIASLDWREVKNLLLIISTYGDGDMPDNAQPFWNFLKSDKAPMLSHIRFSVLALGDRNYTAFCQAGKCFDARLEELGAQRLTPRVDCDVDYEKPATDWLELVLAKLGGDSIPPSLELSEEKGSKSSPGYSRTHPFPARLIANRVLNGATSAKETRHLEISLAESGLSYEVGDALGVMPSNNPALVEEIINALHCDGEEAVTVNGLTETSLRAALQSYCDITKLPLELIREYFTRANAAELLPLLNTGREEDLKKYLYGRELIDLLHSFPQVRLSAADICRFLKKMAPRLYSISSSPLAHPSEVHLTVGIVRYESHGKKRGGVCSTFLADRIGSETTVPVYVQTSHGFRLPVDGQTPIIMVGPGTGIAPFRAFLEEREVLGATGKNWLFFGDQREASDFLYRDAIDAWQRKGHLHRLSTAFSRDQREKIYVQHRMLEETAELWRWLEEGASFYVCGDASRMAKDVDQALHQVVMRGGGLAAEAAAEYVNKLKVGKRYLRDVY